MSEEFTKLQNLISKGKAELLVKKSWRKNDIFGIWLYWNCRVKPSILNLFGKSFILYWLLSCDWLWIPLSIILAVKINGLFLLCILVPFIITHILGPVGQSFIIYDAQNNEDLFEDLWLNKAIGIASVKKRESMIRKCEVPEILIDSYNQDWREKIYLISNEHD